MHHLVFGVVRNSGRLVLLGLELVLLRVPLLLGWVVILRFITLLFVRERCLSVPFVLIQELDLLVVLHLHLPDLGHLLHLLSLCSLLHFLLLPFLSFEHLGAHLFGPTEVNRVVSNESSDGFSAIIDL